MRAKLNDRDGSAAVPRIVHVSSVHHSNDPRIRKKQLRAVVLAGWSATLITGDLGAGEGDDVSIVRVWPGRARRLIRLLVTSPLAVVKALLTKADVYHLHDPELLPWAWFLLLKRKPVVYDVHEDYATSLRQKRYLPKQCRSGVAAVGASLEQAASSVFHRVIAEKYYRRRFPLALSILNYPPLVLLDIGTAFDPTSTKVLYTGNVTLDRGALQLARLLRAAPDWSVTLVGYCPASTAAMMRQEAGDAARRLHLLGEAEFVPFEKIVHEYGKKEWLAGTALFPDTEHYREKELTKFFEYMAVGLPVVASSFPAWRQLIEEQGVGLCVDADDPEAVVGAFRWLSTHPDKAGAMAERGRELVRSVYNWEAEGRRLIAFYSELMGRPTSEQHRAASSEV